MSLYTYQTALGRLIRGPVANRRGEIAYLRTSLSDGEHAYLLRLLNGRGLSFTIDVQRSWCRGRARDAAYMTLAMLPESTQQRLLERWTECGGGTASFFANEADTFLEFIAEHLEPRTHAMSICRMEQAVHRAAQGNMEASDSVSRQIESTNISVAISRYCSLVEFHCDPERLFLALRNRTPLPEISEQSITLLFVPGIATYFRYACEAEIALLTSIRETKKAVVELLSEGHDLRCMENLLMDGAIVLDTLF